MLIEVPSEIKNIKKVSFEILNSLSSLDIAEDKLFDIRLSLEEMVGTAIVDGYNSSMSLKVRVSSKIEKSVLIIEIEDEGAGFGHGNVPDPTHPDNIMKESGRGVYLVRKLMDKVEFFGKGNRVRREKKLD